VAREKHAGKSTSRSNAILRHARLQDKGWTKEELARHAEISAQTVRKAERGQPISETSMARIAKALGIAAGKLFPGASMD
jgi:transcriptional regulator with XRE-family HTH domain